MKNTMRQYGNKSPYEMFFFSSFHDMHWCALRFFVLCVWWLFLVQNANKSWWWKSINHLIVSVPNSNKMCVLSFSILRNEKPFRNSLTPSTFNSIICWLLNYSRNKDEMKKKIIVEKIVIQSNWFVAYWIWLVLFIWFLVAAVVFFFFHFISTNGLCTKPLNS